jgi:dGTPase
MKNNIEEVILKKRKYQKENDIRGEYFRDQTAIIHSMPYRRLKHKTQVFFSPKNDHICTRIEHVQHVATIAATICKGLNNYDWKLDTELAYAIGLGHDLGHSPFGHAGEAALSTCLNTKFIHELNSLRVVDFLANDGKGLNLTYAVRDGIVCHNGEKFEKSLVPCEQLKDLNSLKNRSALPSTWEGCIVRFADKIAYLGRDIEDAITSKLIYSKDIPDKISKFGADNGEIIHELIMDLVETSNKSQKISFSDETFEIVDAMKNFNYNFIYGHEDLKSYIKYVERMINIIFEHLKELYCRFGLDYGKYSREKIPISRAFGEYIKKMKDFYSNEKNVPNQILSDYISGMTDSFAIDAVKQIIIPQALFSTN